MTNEEKEQVLAEMKQGRENAALAISYNETEVERLRNGGELAPDAEYDTVEQEIAAMEYYSEEARGFIYESEQTEIYSDEDRAEILEKEGLRALRDTYTEEDPEYAGLSEEIAWFSSGHEQGQTIEQVAAEEQQGAAEWQQEEDRKHWQAEHQTYEPPPEEINFLEHGDPEGQGITEEEREQITPEPIEYEASPPEVDPVYGHPMAVTGGEKEFWDEDIRKSLAAADLLTAQTREAGQTLDHKELMENNPAYRADFEEREKSQIGQVQSEEEPSQAQDIDRRAEPEEQDAATAEMFEEGQGDAVDERRAAFLQHLEEKIESKQTQEQSKSIGI